MNIDILEKIIDDIEIITDHLLNKEVDCRPHATYMLGRLHTLLNFKLDCIKAEVYEDDD